MLKRAFAILLTIPAATVLWGASYYTQRLQDDRALYLTPDQFGVKGDGVADDTEGIQKAIDKLSETPLRKGVIFVPEGHYRIGKTIYVYAGVRLIGYGARRPVFVLGENTPGYQEGAPKYMVHFVSDRGGFGGGAAAGGRGGRGAPGGAAAQAGRGGQAASGLPEGVRDASPGTFYSGVSNIDIEIKPGNPAAVGVRSHYAQHCFLAHMDFRIGQGRAGIEEVGNAAEDLKFYGGDYGIITTKPSPSWPFALLDAYFEGQRMAAIRTEEGGLTLIRNHFKQAPTVIEINPSRAEQLWMEDSLMEDISGPALIISDETSTRPEINLQNVSCRNVPVLAKMRDSGKQIAGTGATYSVKVFAFGVHIADIGATPVVKTTVETAPLSALPPLPKSDLPPLPPADTWANVKTLGVKGDATTDDTAAIRDAIARNRTLYFPSGGYRITDTITLRPDTVLIGLNPIATQFILPDSTPAFQGVGLPKPLVEAPKGGTNIMMGIGIDAGGINPRAVGVKWMAGANSLMNDVRFLGGHGTMGPNGERVQNYNANRTGDGNPLRRWDSQYSSLWITDGGGGTFFDIWTPDTFAQAGIFVSDTTTEGRVYELSSEHHVRNEMKVRHIANWKFYAMQFEEERGEGPDAYAVEIEHSQDLLFANLYLFRVGGVNPVAYAVRIDNSTNLKFRNVHLYGPSKYNYDDTFLDTTHNATIRTREIAYMTLSGHAPAPKAAHVSPVLAAGAKVQKLAGIFNSIDGGAVDAAGNYYFVDSRFHRIWRYGVEKPGLTLVRDAPLDPAALAFDKSGNLLVISRTAGVYAIRPEGKDDEITFLKPEPAAPRPGMTPILAVGRWRDGHDFNDFNARPYTTNYISPDQSVFIPVRGNGTSDLMRGFGVAPAVPGKPYYMADEFNQRTIAFTVNPDGTLTDPKVVAEEAEVGQAVDAAGNLYVAAGQIFVYNSAGNKIDTIEVPERPTNLMFGGKDGQTLFIAARHGLYSVRTKNKGR
jgi:sugar lactone lactonase YvrE